MHANFNEALRRLLKHEGGYSDHASDPGGPTNFGITIHDFRKYVNPHGTAADVRVMSIEAAKKIYRAKYWDAMRCDELPAGVDYAVFDYGVHSGVGRAPKVLQRCLGITADGVIGPATLAAVAKADARTLIKQICDERLTFLQSLKTWPVFGRGWGPRVAQVRAAALAMAGAPTPKPAPLSAKEPAIVTGAGGLVATIAHYLGAPPEAVVAVLILTAIGVGYVVIRSRRR